jgi:hypothetical protein
MTEEHWQSAVASSDMDSGSFVWLVVTLAGTSQDREHGCAVTVAQIADVLGTWFQCGGWRSIRIEPMSARKGRARFGGL